MQGRTFKCGNPLAAHMQSLPLKKIRGCHKKQLLPVTPEQHQYFRDSLWQALVLVETHIYKTGK